MKFYHGTSADNLKSIKRFGLDASKGKQNWTVSCAPVYLWNPAKLDGGEDEARTRAAESAEFCLTRAKDCRRVVIEVDIDPEETIEDDSCENMEEAVYINRVIKPSEITAIWVDKESLSLFQGYFISFHIDRELSEPLVLNDLEKCVMKLFNRANDFCCEAFEILSDLVYSMEKIK
jgi:hypothetical protein